LSGKPVAARAPRCASVLEKRGELWQGTLSSGAVTLTALPTKAPEHSAGCPSPGVDARQLSSISSHGDCLEGVDGGEFGGVVRVIHAGKTTELMKGPWLRVAHLVEIGDDVWVLTHDAHFTHPRAPLVRLHFETKSGWSAKTIDRLPGEPQAFGRDGAGRLLILTEDLTGDCPGRAMTLLAVSPDARIESLP
jgi:hypothetical protein